MAKITAKLKYALTNTYSGVAGEMAVATALIRAGHRVSKPYWNDDEIDLIVFKRSGLSLLPIPVQAKSIQRLDRDGDEFAVSGLKRKYVDRQPALCLAIYSPESGKIWFIAGADNIRTVHRAGVLKSHTAAGRNRTAYDSLQPDDDVKIYVNLTDNGDPSFDQEWLIDTASPTKLNKAIDQVADLLETGALTKIIESFWQSEDEAVDPIDPIESGTE